MKTTFALFSLLFTISLTGFAQCDKNLVLSSPLTEHLDGGILSNSKDEVTRLEISKYSIILKIDGEERGVMSITSQTCNWPVPFKEGKTIFKVTMGDDTYTITIEGKEGKLSLNAKKDAEPDHIIRLSPDKFEESI